jgi:integrase
MSMVSRMPDERSSSRGAGSLGTRWSILREQLERQVAERRAWGPGWVETGLAFTHENGSALTPEMVSRRFALLSRRAGLPKIRFHGLRHTSASLALAAGVAMKTVSDRLGHSTTSITADLYTHVSPAVASQAADAIADLISERGRKDGGVPAL